MASVVYRETLGRFQVTQPVAARSQFRVALPQVLAVLVKNVLLVAYGMTIGFPTILIPNVNGNNPEETFALGPEAISWIGSISLITVPVGCLASGAITQKIGRRLAMQIVNIPLVIAWLLLHYATEVWMLYTALAVTGLTGGLLEAPVLTYVAEITQPHLRGLLSATSTTAVITGILIQFLQGTFLPWRRVAVLSIIAPILSFVLLMFVPESPLWLISKRKFAKAKRSLAWLRGWVTEHEIEAEFRELYKVIVVNEVTGIDNPALTENGNILKTPEPKQAPQKQSLADSLREFSKKTFVVPCTLVGFSFFLGHFIGMTTLQTYAVPIFAVLKIPIDKYYATMILGIVEMLGCVICVTLIHYVGKRPLAFFSTIGSGSCFIVVATYAYYLGAMDLKMASNAGGTFANATSSANQTEAILEAYNWVPMTFLIGSALISHCGIRLLPWVLIGEVFPNEIRAASSGITSSLGYIFGFLANKTFFKLIDALTLPGTFWFYGGLAWVGTIILYFILPETEGKPLHEIIDHFAGHKRLNNSVRKRQHKIEDISMKDSTCFEERGKETTEKQTSRL